MPTSSLHTWAGAAACETMHCVSARSGAVQGIAGTGLLVAVDIGVLVAVGGGVSSGSVGSCSVDMTSRGNRRSSDEIVEQIRSEQNEGIRRNDLRIPSGRDRLTSTVLKGSKLKEPSGQGTTFLSRQSPFWKIVEREPAGCLQWADNCVSYEFGTESRVAIGSVRGRGAILTRRFWSRGGQRRTISITAIWITAASMNC